MIDDFIAKYFGKMNPQINPIGVFCVFLIISFLVIGVLKLMGFLRD